MSEAIYSPLRRPTFQQLWESLLHTDETLSVEAKRSEELGRSALETISAFANEPGGGGGYLLLGVSQSATGDGYVISGIPDPDKVQNDLASQCAEAFNVVVRPQVTVEEVEGKVVVIVFVPEVQPYEKPVYIKSRGLPRGAFRRIGSTDQHCTDEDLSLFHQLQSQASFEATPLTEASLEDMEDRAIAEYRRLRSGVNSSAVELTYDDEDLLLALGATTRIQGNTYPTIAGLLLFGSPLALRRQFPMFRVDYIRVSGREWVSSVEHRYESAVERREPLMLLASSVVRTIIDDLPKVFAASEDGIYRRDVPAIPNAVIREATVNALVHQNFRVPQPTQVIRYSNRLEIRNPGSSLVAIDQLGEPGSWPRNPRIAAVLHDVGLAENKGTGIRIMRQAMEQANLSVPLLDSDREANRFVVTLLTHHFFGPEDVAWLAGLKDCNLSDDEARVLVVVRENGAINNAMYRDVCRVDTLTASKHLQRLRDLDLLEQKGRGAATYYVPGERFLISLDGVLSTELSLANKGASSPNKGPGSLNKDRNSVDKARTSVTRDDDLTDMPQLLQQEVSRLGQRSDPTEIRSVIVHLCGWRPLTASQLSSLLGRGQPYIVSHYLRPMLQAGVLEQTYPGNPTHPLQAYRARGSSDEPAR